MSLINQMLKDLEKRRSSDLETSPTLNRNINWETRPNSSSFEWGKALIILVVLLLLGVIAFLVWERSGYQQKIVETSKVTTVVAKSSQTSSAKPVTRQVNNAPQKKVKQEVKAPQTLRNEVEEVVSSRAYTEAVETEGAINTDMLENDIAPAKINKKVREPSKEQQAEIVYQEAYRYLQKNNPSMGKQKLLSALEMYPSHIKAREILAGIYIRSGHYVDAAALLKEGIRLIPEYSLFAKLYARVLLEQNNPHEAIKVLEKGATVLEVEPDYYALLAATYQRVDKHQQAIKLYLQLVKLQPGAGVWWLGLGISLEKSGKNTEALEAFQRALNTGSLNSGLKSFAEKQIAFLNKKTDQSN